MAAVKWKDFTTAPPDECSQMKMERFYDSTIRRMQSNENGKILRQHHQTNAVK
jgi:hypothetical protein